MRRLRNLTRVFGSHAGAARDVRGSASAQGSCVSCRYFRNGAAFLEAAIPGLASLSSASASVRADDGLCLLHDRYRGARATCARFAVTLGASPPAESI